MTAEVEKPGREVIRQAVAVMLTALLAWVFSRFFMSRFSTPILSSPVPLTLGEALQMGLMVVLAWLIVGMGGPLRELYKTHMERWEAASGVTSNLLKIPALLVLYWAFEGIVVALLSLFIEPGLAQASYELFFLLVGIIIVYSLIKSVIRAL